MSHVLGAFLPVHQACNEFLLLPHLELLWPGGCLLQGQMTWSDQAEQREQQQQQQQQIGLWVVVSSGLTNPDMPTRLRLERFHIGQSSEGSQQHRQKESGGGGGDGGEVVQRIFDANGIALCSFERDGFASTASLRPRLDLGPSWAGYGYEIGVITRTKESWPSHCLAFMVSKAVMDDYNLRGVIEQFGAATFERVPIRPDRTAHFLIARAPAQLYPKETIDLPNGSMQLFLMTAITEEELQFGMHNRALDLYYRLQHAGCAYISDLDRPSINLHREDDRIADEAAASGDLAMLGSLLNRGYRVFPGNPILCLAVKKGRDDRSASEMLRFFMDKRWKGGSSGRDKKEQASEPRPDSDTPVLSVAGEGEATRDNRNATATDQELIQRLAQVRDEDNYTGLHWAARNNFPECARLLLEKGGVDIEIRGTRTAVTSLHLAANFGSLETLQLLIDKGANLNSDAFPDRKGEVTPLMLALDSEDKRSYEACKRLIKAGVNVNTQDWAGSTVLHKMSRVVPRYLVKAIEFPGKEKGREVSYFIREGEFGKRVENRIDERYLIDYPEAEEELFNKYFGAFCPMHRVYLSMLGKLSLLLRSGADKQLRNHAGMLALHNFAGEGGLREVRLLLDQTGGKAPLSREERAANWKKVINTRDDAGRTPLWLACAHEKGPEMATKMARLLIHRGADVLLGDECGITPLHAAVVSGHLPLVSLLVSHGASPHALTTAPGGGQLRHGSPDHYAFPAGVSPVQIAKEEGHLHILDFFQQAKH